MIDLTDTIVPRSDQVNADDLMAGPMTCTISDVKLTGADDQPVAIHLREFPFGRPYKPSKGMRRLLVLAWGKDAAAYVGRCLTLYRDPAITFGKDAVGGIRISHLSHIGKPLTVALTVKKGKREAITVQPLPSEQPPPDYLADAQAATTLDDVRALYRRASAAGHLTRELEAALKARGDALSQPSVTAETEPTLPVENEPEDGAA